ncbi:MAG: hypothetical protein AAF960_19100 [Bacteroidota bacterium]
MSNFTPYQLIILLSFLLSSLAAQTSYDYEPSNTNPFGQPNPKAPQQIKDFAPLIGECNCDSYARNPDRTWPETPTKMLWRWKYIMNGMGVQDETLKADGIHSGSIRQFNTDSLQWYVHYYASNAVTPTLSSWSGAQKEDGTIVLYKEQKAPNGMDGFYKITFSNISNEGFDWLGEWVTPDESFVYPTWRIECKKREN